MFPNVPTKFRRRSGPAAPARLGRRLKRGLGLGLGSAYLGLGSEGLAPRWSTLGGRSSSRPRCRRERSADDPLRGLRTQVVCASSVALEARAGGPRRPKLLALHKQLNWLSVLSSALCVAAIAANKWLNKGAGALFVRVAGRDARAPSNHAAVGIAWTILSLHLLSSSPRGYTLGVRRTPRPRRGRSVDTRRGDAVAV